MSGYLSNLAHRALEHPLAVRPRLASIFEQPSTSFGVTAAALTQSRTTRVTRPPRVQDLDASRSFEPQPPVVHHRNEPQPPAVHHHNETQPPAVHHHSKPQPSPREPAPAEGSLARQTFSNKTNATWRRVEAEAPRDHRDSQEPPAPGPVLAMRDEQSNTSDRFARGSDQLIAHPVVVSLLRGASRALSEKTTAEVKPATRERHPLDEPARIMPASAMKDEPSRITLPRAGVEALAAPKTTQAFEPRERAFAIQPALEGAPTIRITIGRVDVRAIMPAANTKAPVTKASSGEALSLDEYLKHRSGVKP